MDDYVNSEKKEYDKNLNQRNRDGKTIMDTSQTAYITATESRNESFDGISNSYSEEEEEDSLLVGDDGSLIDGESKNHKCRKILVGSIFLGFLIFVVVYSATTRYLGSSISTLMGWIESNPAIGFLAFVAVYVVCTVLFIPASILTVGAGFVFTCIFGISLGVLLGTITVFVSASIGAVVAFLLGRYLLRDWVISLARKYIIFEALDACLEEKGFRIMMLLRLSPIIPFNVIDYLASITAVSFKDYALAMVGILPGVVLYVFLGASAGSLVEGTGSKNMTVTIIVIVVGVIFGIIAIAVTSYYAKKELNRMVASRNSPTVAVEEGESRNKNSTTIHSLPQDLIEQDHSFLQQQNYHQEAREAEDNNSYDSNSDGDSYEA